jgi:hypothetical protein
MGDPSDTCGGVQEITAVSSGDDYADSSAKEWKRR